MIEASAFDWLAGKLQLMVCNQSLDKDKDVVPMLDERTIELKLMRNLLLSSFSMTAMTSHENDLLHGPQSVTSESWNKLEQSVISEYLINIYFSIPADS